MKYYILLVIVSFSFIHLAAQVDDKRILLFLAWPRNIDVHFKLHAPYNTTVEVELRSGKVILLKVLPEERAKDVKMMLK